MTLLGFRKYVKKVLLAEKRYVIPCVITSWFIIFLVRKDNDFTLKQGFLSLSTLSSSDSITSVAIAFKRSFFISSGNRTSSNFPIAVCLLCSF